MRKTYQPPWRVSFILNARNAKLSVFSLSIFNCVFFMFLKEAQVVMLVGGMARKPGMTRDDLFAKNASVVEEVTMIVAEKCPKALFGIVTNPVNSCVPLAAEVLKKVYRFQRFIVLYKI